MAQHEQETRRIADTGKKIRASNRHEKKPITTQVQVQVGLFVGTDARPDGGGFCGVHR